MKKNFFIDLDDTITPTGYRYSQVTCEFCHYLYDKLDRNVPFIRDLVLLQTDLDLKLIKKQKFFKTRFPYSLVLTYKEVCRKAGIKPQKEMEREIKKIGERVFDMSYYENNYIEGVEETLEFLVSQQDNITLLTMGDELIQSNKIKALDLKKYFKKNTIIVPEKNEQVYKTIGKEIQNPYMIGDSKRSDINHSVKAGWNAIWVPMPGGTWAHDQQIKEELTEEENKRVIKLKEFKEIKEKYSSL